MSEEVEKVMAKIHLQKNNGLYTHNDVNMLIKSMRSILKSIFNPGKYGLGIKGLYDLGATSTIKLKDFMMASIILANAVAEEKKKKDKSDTLNVVVMTTIVDCPNAKDKANWNNQIMQAVIVAKQVATEAIVTFVGAAITNHVLRTIDGKDLNTIAEYTLVDLTNAIKQGAEGPMLPDILEQFVTVQT